MDPRDARSSTPITWTLQGPMPHAPDTYRYQQDQDPEVTCIVSKGVSGANEWHLSLKHPHRTPTPEEIGSAVRAFIPEDVRLEQFDDAASRPPHLGHVVHLIEL